MTLEFRTVCMAVIAGTITGVLLAGCSSTQLAATTAEGDHLEVTSSNLFQNRYLSYDPTTGQVVYTSDPQGQQAADTAKAIASGVAQGIVAGVSPIPIPVKKP